MSKTYKHQATYDYLHENKTVNGKLLHGLKRFFMRCNFSRYDYSRIKWFKHKNRNEERKIQNYPKEGYE